MKWLIEKLASRHSRETFDCGNGVLNRFLEQLAGQYTRRDLAETFVAFQPDSNRVLGYYAISTSSINYESLPQSHSRKLPRIHIPVVLLGRLAVDLSVQGRGLGRILLGNALERVASVAAQVGIAAVEVYAIDAAARAFYVKNTFVPLLDDPNHLYLPMAFIRKLVAQVDQGG